MLVDIIVLVILVITAIVFYKGYGASVIEWFNTMPKYEREQRDMVKLSVFLGKLLFIACGCVVLFIIGEWADLFYITAAGLVILVGTAVFGYFYTHTGDRFNKK